MRIAGDFNHTERTSSKSLELMGFHYPKPVSSTTEATIFSVILRFLKVKRTPKGEWEAEIWDPIRGCTYLLSGYDCPEKALVRAFHDAAFTLRSNRKAQLNFPQLLIQLHHQYSFLGEMVVSEYLKMEASRSIQDTLRENLYVDYVTQVFPGICLSNMDPGIYNLLGHMAVRRPKVLESNYYLQASGESLYDYPLKSLRQYRFPAFDDFSWESIVYKYDEKPLLWDFRSCFEAFDRSSYINELDSLFFDKNELDSLFWSKHRSSSRRFDWSGISSDSWVFDSLSFHIDERDFPFRSRRRSSSRRRLDWGSSSSDSWGIWGNQRNAPWHVVNINDDDDDEVFVAAKRVKRMRKEFNKFLKLYSNSMSCPPDLRATLAATFYGFQASQIWALGNPLDLLSSPSNTTLGFKDAFLKLCPSMMWSAMYLLSFAYTTILVWSLPFRLPVFTMLFLGLVYYLSVVAFLLFGFDVTLFSSFTISGLVFTLIGAMGFVIIVGLLMASLCIIVDKSSLLLSE